MRRARPIALAVAATIASAWAAGWNVGAAFAAPPEGFVYQPIGDGWQEVVGGVELEDGRVIMWERGGRVWMVEADGTKHDSPMLDLHEEVGAWRDHGLLSVVPHPNYLQNGYLYLLYVVDRHHLLSYGTPEYDPNADWYYAASIGRITRYEANAADNFASVDPATRKVLLGESVSTGIPIVHQSHGVGTLLFGEDGTLLVSVGDCASYESLDTGGQVSGGYVNQALADGILTPEENVGAFRAQLLQSLCGKVLRLDAETGDGIASNPFFDPAAPRSARSRVWCLGLRNPFRMAIEPDSGSHVVADADPGTLLIGDVGWNAWEETNRAESGGLNFGWPIFEGLEHHPDYARSDAVNLFAANPLGESCEESHLRFRSLLVQDSTAEPTFLNPCAMSQAEDATLSNASAVNTSAGYLGDGFAAFGGAGSWAQWSITVPEGGASGIAARYANTAASPIALKVLVDGQAAGGGVSLPPTTTATEWRVATAPLALAAGRHVIRVQQLTAGGGLALDGVEVYGADGPHVLPDATPHFTHARPIVDWLHGGPSLSRVPTFTGGAATVATVGTPESGVDGAPWKGFCSIGGPLVHFGSWPEEYHERWLVGDFAFLWLRVFELDAEGGLASVGLFDPTFGSVVAIFPHTSDETIWAVRWGTQVTRIAYAPDINQPPTIVVATSQPWGPSPLAVTFDASGTADPEGTDVTLEWDFGDGSPTEEGASVEHVFVARSDAPQSFVVTLTARDADGIESAKELLVSANNSPPFVEITSFADGQLYSMQGKTILPLVASVADAESPADALTCSWTAILHHNTHEHPEPADPECVSEAVITPLGCGSETYWYEMSLTVTDPFGLATTVSGSLYPDCMGVLECGADLDGDAAVGPSDLAILLGLWGRADAAADLNDDGVVGSADLAILLGAWGPC